MDKYSEYKDLTPISNAENVEEYLNALKWALDQKKITNIALAGPYGSGKSSIIDTFLEKHKDESFFQTYTSENNSWIIKKIKSCILQCDKVSQFSEISKKISMATFIEANSNEQCKNGADKKICINADEVEKGILKQLFYTIDPQKIPQSRYRKLHPVNFKNVITKVAIYSVIALILVFVFYYEKMTTIFSGISAIVSWIGMSVVSYIAVFMAFIVCVWAISQIIFDFSSKYNIKGIKLSSNVDIQKEEGAGESVFNKNLDEIMYFFETTEYCLIFFEDLDRLDDRTIFVHLRELNNLLNSNETIKEKVVFVYAVKDDIFNKEDRTKFFDFIIPVIPIINSTNSGEVLQQFLNEAKEHGIEHAISQDFVLDVAPYIADMRILRNIYNEFVVYKSILRAGQGVELKDEQMLAVIIYKNLCPSDFAYIQNEQGLIKQAFEDKYKFVSEEKSRLQIEINELSNSIDDYKQEILKSIKEIKIAMLVNLTKDQGIVKELWYGYYSRDMITANQILSDEFKLDYFKEHNIERIVYYDFMYGRSNDINISNFNKAIEPYVKRIRKRTEIESKGLNEFSKKIRNLKELQRSIVENSMRDILEKYNDFKFSRDIGENKLLVFLLRRGYIDEKYANYINYFKGNTITKDDMNFILSVKNQEAKPWDYAITKTDMVIRRLQEYEFERKEIYNFDLLEQLLAGGNDNVKLDLFFKQLADETKLSWDFIDEFTERTNHLAEFIKGLSRNWAGLWLFISNKNTISYERQVYYLCLLLANISADDVSQYNIDGCMEKYFEAHADILQKLQEQLGSEKINDILLQLQPKFSELNIDGIEDKEILDTVFDNAMYELNLPMVKNVIKFKNSMLIDSFEAKPYSVVVRLGYDLMNKYIQNNIKQYVSDIILKQANPEDEFNDILSLVQKLFEEDEYELIVELIKHETFKIGTISKLLGDKIDENKEQVQFIWKTMLEAEKIAVSWGNIIIYWVNYKIDDSLKNFIIRNINSLVKANRCCCNDSFISELILCGLPISAYEVLLPVLRMSDFSMSLTDIPKEVLEIMVSCKYFAFTPDKFSELKDIDKSLAVEYISLNQDEAIENTNDLDIDSALLNKILTSTKITTSNKEQFLEVFDVTYMTSEIVISINELNLKITKETFESAWNVANHDDRLKLFFDHLSLFTADDFERYFSEIGGEYATLSDRTKRYQPVISCSENNSNLVERLKEVGYITSYNVEQKANSKEKQIRCVIKRKS